MNLRPGKIRQPSGMIEIEMGDNDMPDVIRTKSEFLYLFNRSFRNIQLGSDEIANDKPQWAGMRQILQSQAGIDKNQIVPGLDQQTMADHHCWRKQTARAIDKFGAHRTKRRAIQMMDSQAIPPRLLNSQGNTTEL
jgi:hypothetical protein